MADEVAEFLGHGDGGRAAAVGLDGGFNFFPIVGGDAELGEFGRHAGVGSGSAQRRFARLGGGRLVVGFCGGWAGLV